MSRSVQAGLLSFLLQARQASARHIAGGSSSPTPIYVLGNQSADLDSIVSAITYSFFMHRQHHALSSASQSPTRLTATKQRLHVPLINLPDVPATKLWRLRPEFVAALWLSTSFSRALGGDTTSVATAEVVAILRDAIAVSSSLEQLVSEHVLTVADLRMQFQKRQAGGDSTSAAPCSLDVVLVDWNALPSQTEEGKGIGVIDALPNVKLSVIGCIDHHQEEYFVPPIDSLPVGQPRVIQLGPGSCASLIVRDLQDQGFWAPTRHHPHPEDEGDISLLGDEGAEATAISEAEAAQLALSAILIDTSNLTAADKVTDLDLEAVSFLEGKIETGCEILRSSNTTTTTTTTTTPTNPGDASHLPRWNRTAFFEEIRCMQQNSLDFLTFQEILGRDYKEWTETSSTGKVSRVGICSIVKPISWLIKKAGEEEAREVAPATVHGYRDRSDDNKSSFHTPPFPLSPYLTQMKPFLERVLSFARSEHYLDVIAIMTAFNASSPSPDGQTFQRELLLWAIDNSCVAPVQKFTTRAVSELGLEEWRDNGGTLVGSASSIGADSATKDARSSDGKTPFQEDPATDKWSFQSNLVSSHSSSALFSGWIQLWRQRNTAKSRKQVAPLLRDVFRQ